MLTLEQLNALDRAEFTGAIGHIFEHSPWIAWTTWEQRPFADADALAAALVDTMLAASTTQQLTLILAHPDLAGKAALDNELTAESAREQASAGLDRLSRQEYVLFHELNGAYWAKFAFPFIICVRRHDKNSILSEFKRRLIRDEPTERRQALLEIGEIARLRLADLLHSQAEESTHG